MCLPRALFRVFSVFFKQTWQFLQQMSIQGMGLKLTTFRARISSHYHKTGAPALQHTCYYSPDHGYSKTIKVYHSQTCYIFLLKQLTLSHMVSATRHLQKILVEALAHFYRNVIT